MNTQRVDVVIRTDKLTKRYGAVEALRDLDLEVAGGGIFGFLGPNGAGKTTTIKLLVDLVRPTRGRAEVLGLDSRVDSVAIRARTGVVSDDLQPYGDLTGDQLVDFTAALRGGLDRAWVATLAERLDVDLRRPVRKLSTGNRQKVELLLAFAPRPPLLILDEPTAGLDPLVQQEVGALLREARGEGRTVFLSSHVLSEVAHLADRIGILREGRLIAVEDLAALRRTAARRLTLRFAGDAPAAAFAGLPGVRDVRAAGDSLSLSLDGSVDPVLKTAARFEVLELNSAEADLEELFFDYYRRAEDA